MTTISAQPAPATAAVVPKSGDDGFAAKAISYVGIPVAGLATVAGLGAQYYVHKTDKLARTLTHDVALATEELGHPPLRAGRWESDAVRAVHERYVQPNAALAVKRNFIYMGEDGSRHFYEPARASHIVGESAFENAQHAIATLRNAGQSGFAVKSGNWHVPVAVTPESIPMLKAGDSYYDGLLRTPGIESGWNDARQEFVRLAHLDDSGRPFFSQHLRDILDEAPELAKSYVDDLRQLRPIRTVLLGIGGAAVAFGASALLQHSARNQASD